MLEEDGKSAKGPNCKQFKSTVCVFFFFFFHWLPILPIQGASHGDQKHFGAARTHFGSWYEPFGPAWDI